MYQLYSGSKKQQQDIINGHTLESVVKTFFPKPGFRLNRNLCSCGQHVLFVTHSLVCGKHSEKGPKPLDASLTKYHLHTEAIMTSAAWRNLYSEDLLGGVHRPHHRLLQIGSLQIFRLLLSYHHTSTMEPPLASIKAKRECVFVVMSTKHSTKKSISVLKPFKIFHNFILLRVILTLIAFILSSFLRPMYKKVSHIRLV
jgi:hypothetical protein